MREIQIRALSTIAIIALAISVAAAANAQTSDPKFFDPWAELG